MPMTISHYKTKNPEIRKILRLKKTIIFLLLTIIIEVKTN